MNIRIIMSVCGAAGLALAACGDKKDETPQPLNCVAADGSAIPCPAGAGGSRTDQGAVEQQK